MCSSVLNYRKPWKKTCRSDIHQSCISSQGEWLEKNESWKWSTSQCHCCDNGFKTGLLSVRSVTLYFCRHPEMTTSILRHFVTCFPNPWPHFTLQNGGWWNLSKAKKILTIGDGWERTLGIQGIARLSSGMEIELYCPIIEMWLGGFG